MESSQCWVKVCFLSDMCSPLPAGTWVRFKTGILSTRSEQNLLRINTTGCLSLPLRRSVVGGFLGQTGIPTVVFCFGQQPRKSCVSNSDADCNTAGKSQDEERCTARFAVSKWDSCSCMIVSRDTRLKKVQHSCVCMTYWSRVMQVTASKSESKPYSLIVPCWVLEFEGIGPGKVFKKSIYVWCLR